TREDVLIPRKPTLDQTAVNDRPLRPHQGRIAVRDRQVHRLKRGIARIALEVVAQEPTNPIQILPVAIDYDDPYQAWGCGVQIRIGQGIKVNQFDPGAMKTSSEALTQALFVALQEINENQPAKVLVS
ncbi:MAG: hypothetical protein ACKN9E_02935, partial [Microcystaceae cyanobacterium]